MLLAAVVGVMLTVSPSAGGKHHRFAVRITTRRAAKAVPRAGALGSSTAP
jgi:hypothetical protein